LTNEAKLLAQAQRHREEYNKAIAEGVDVETLAYLRSVQEKERDALMRSFVENVKVTKSYESATRRAGSAIRETAKAANEAARILNAPQGLRLSLLQWRATAMERGGIPTSRSAGGLTGHGPTESIARNIETMMPRTTVDFTTLADLPEMRVSRMTVQNMDLPTFTTTNGAGNYITNNFNVSVIAEKGQDGEQILDNILVAANRRARAGAGNVFENLREDV